MADIVKPATKGGDAKPPPSIHEGVAAEAPAEAGDLELLGMVVKSAALSMAAVQSGMLVMLMCRCAASDPGVQAGAEAPLFYHANIRGCI